MTAQFQKIVPAEAIRAGHRILLPREHKKAGTAVRTVALEEFVVDSIMLGLVEAEIAVRPVGRDDGRRRIHPFPLGADVIRVPSEDDWVEIAEAVHDRVPGALAGEGVVLAPMRDWDLVITAAGLVAALQTPLPPRPLFATDGGLVAPDAVVLIDDPTKTPGEIELTLIEYPPLEVVPVPEWTTPERLPCLYGMKDCDHIDCLAREAAEAVTE